MRKVEKVDETGEFCPTTFEMLKKGDKFRLFEHWGALILNDDGGTVFTAYSDPEIDEHFGVWKVKTKDTSTIESSVTEGDIRQIVLLEKTVEKLKIQNERLKNSLDIANSWIDDIGEPGC